MEQPLGTYFNGIFKFDKQSFIDQNVIYGFLHVYINYPVQESVKAIMVVIRLSDYEFVATQEHRENHFKDTNTAHTAAVCLVLMSQLITIFSLSE